jgi:hypothetical protein
VSFARALGLLHSWGDSALQLTATKPPKACCPVTERRRFKNPIRSWSERSIFAVEKVSLVNKLLSTAARTAQFSLLRIDFYLVYFALRTEKHS